MACVLGLVAKKGNSCCKLPVALNDSYHRLQQREKSGPRLKRKGTKWRPHREEEDHAVGDKDDSDASKSSTGADTPSSSQVRSDRSAEVVIFRIICLE